MLKSKLLILLILIVYSKADPQFIENFETGMPTSVTTGNVNLSSGQWYITNAKRANPGYNGYGLTINNGSSKQAYVLTPQLSKVASVALMAKGSGNSLLNVKISTDGGTIFTDVPGSPVAITAAWTSYNFQVNDVNNNDIIKLENTTVQTLYIDEVNIITGIVPNIIISTTSLNSFGSTVIGESSPSQSYSVSGNNLTDNIKITAPAGFKVSLNNTVFEQMIVLSSTGGSVAGTTVYAKFFPQSASGKLQSAIVHTSLGAVTKNISVEGRALDVEPTNQASINFGPVTGNSIVTNMSGGNGYNRILVVREGLPVSWIPTDGSTITGIDSNFSIAADQGNGNKVVFNLPDSISRTVRLSGLNGGTKYFFAVYEFNSGALGSENYLTLNPGTADQTTMKVPTISANPSNLQFWNVLVNTYSAEKTYSLSAKYLVPANGNVTVTAPPNFEVSETSGGGFATSINIAYTDSSLLPKTIYVRFKPTVISQYTGIIANSRGELAIANVNVSGFGKDSSGISSKEIFVSPTGNDQTGTGTIDNPYKSIYKAGLKLLSDYTLILRGGIYAGDSLHLKNKSLTNIAVIPYLNEKPVIDATGSYDAVILYCSNSLFRGIEVKKAGHNGIWIMGHSNRIENCVFHHGGDSGLKIGSHYETDFPRDNVVVNCDSYANYDSRGNGGNADGFSAKWNIGSGNKFIGCRAWENSDDGWDLWQADSTVIMDSCWCFRNGYDIFNVGSDGNGNGFKIGGAPVCVPHILTNCIAFDNKGSSGGKGFDQNSNLAGHTMYNNLSFGNSYLNFNFYRASTNGQLVAKNNISYKGKANPEIKFVDGDVAKNSWQIGITVTDNDFISIDTSLARLPRKPDGSLPVTDLYRLKTGSKLINAGINVGLPYAGSAPDLGPFESGLSTSIPYQRQTGPRVFELYQNYPNPFNPQTEICFKIPKEEYVTLKVTDILGEVISTLINEKKPEGVYRISFNGAKLSAGIYIYTLMAGDSKLSKKMILLK